MTRQLIAVMRKSEDLINMWPKKERFRLLVPDAPIIKPMKRKAIGQKLLEENKDTKSGKKYLKF